MYEIKIEKVHKHSLNQKILLHDMTFQLITGCRITKLDVVHIRWLIHGYNK